MKRLLLILVFFVGCVGSSQTVERVLDGDTFILSNGEKIRLAEIDAPEMGQIYSIEAREYVEKLILYKNVKVIRTGKDKYGRTIARVVIGNDELSSILVKKGLAHCTPWSSNKIKWECSIARQNRVGLFQYPYELPYKFRRKYKLH